MSIGTRSGTMTRLDGALLALVAIAAAAAVVGFRAVFADWSFLAAAITGAGCGALTVAAAWKFRLLIGESIALSVVAFVIVGIVVAGPVPGGDAVNALVDGLLNGWADLLSLSPPADVTAELRVLPFALAWAGITIGGELLRRTSAPGLAVVGPLIALTVSVLVTAEDRQVAIVQGVVIAVSALVVGFAQFVRTVTSTVIPAAPTSSTREGADLDLNPERSVASEGSHMASASGVKRQRRRLVRAALALGAVAIAAPFIGPRLPLADAYERFDLRDRNDPPWDPLSVPSPLVQIKSEFKTDRRDDVVLTIESNEPVERLNLAVLGDFDGVVWTVGSTDNTDASSEFRPVGSALPDRPLPIDDPRTAGRATITINDLEGPWLPAPAGWPTSATFEDTSAAGATTGGLRMNLATGTLAVPSGLESGMRYEIGFELGEQYDDAVLSASDIEPLLPSDEDDVLPPQIQNLTADIVQGIDRGWPQVAAIRDRFVNDGFYDTSPDSRPGHSFFRVGEFLDDPDRLVGYEEQYAAAAAVVARSAQLPARVVVGYRIPEERYTPSSEGDVAADVTAQDISAWIEVNVDGRGWIAVDVTPDRSREPVEQASGVTIEDVATPSPPPPPQVPPKLDILASEEEPEEDEEEDEDDEDEEEVAHASGIGIATGAAIGVGIATTLTLLAAAFVLLLKLVRRRRRRATPDPALRVGLAWREVLDRYEEAGLHLAERSTPGEVMHTFQTSDLTSDESSSELRSLVAVVQRSAYHVAPPAQPDGDVAWKYHDAVVANLYERRTWPQRLRMRIDPRTLRTPGWSDRARARSAPAQPPAHEDVRS